MRKAGEAEGEETEISERKKDVFAPCRLFTISLAWNKTFPTEKRLTRSLVSVCKERVWIIFYPKKMSGPQSTSFLGVSTTTSVRSTHAHLVAFLFRVRIPLLATRKMFAATMRERERLSHSPLSREAIEMHIKSENCRKNGGQAKSRECEHF